MSVDELNRLCRNTLVSHLGIQITAAGPEGVSGSMPIDDHVRQPMGVLHGGASVALAETLASIGAFLAIDTTRKHCVGLEINANHIRAVTAGQVHGSARPLHLGSSTQVWGFEILDQQEALVCVGRITMAVLDRQP